MNYLHTSRAAWVASSERLASGGGYLSTDGSPAAVATSTPGSLTSGGDHLCTGGLPATTTTSARAKRSLPPSSYGGENKTIQERDRHLPGV